jgi:hypothetical protein
LVSQGFLLMPNYVEYGTPSGIAASARNQVGRM